VVVTPLALTLLIAILILIVIHCVQFVPMSRLMSFSDNNVAFRQLFLIAARSVLDLKCSPMNGRTGRCFTKRLLAQLFGSW
jgi:hypothetical protein